MNDILLHKNLCDKMHDLYVRKNRDYGDSFHRTFVEEGFGAARIRLSDKLNRFKNITKASNEELNLVDESIRDTLMDLANYALMTIIELDRENHYYISKGEISDE